MDKVPVTFTHEGKEYNATIDEVNGAAAKVWHLMIEGFYYGQLVFTGNKFIFHPQLDKYAWMKDFEGYFGEVITLWYE